MITWVTVWVLTVIFNDSGSSSHVRRDSYQLQYATQSICERQKENHTKNGATARCDFAQIPVYKSK